MFKKRDSSRQIINNLNVVNYCMALSNYSYFLTIFQNELYINKRSVLRRQSRDTNRNIKRLVYCQYGWYSLTFRALALVVWFFFSLSLSDEESTLETLDYTIRIGSTPTFLYFDLHKIINIGWKVAIG